MRSVLTSLNVVQAMLVFREGPMIRITLDYYLGLADHTVVMLDNPDDETESIVREYEKLYPDTLHVFSSTFPRLSPEEEKIPLALNRRFKHNEGVIRNELLQHVHDLNKKYPIDILLWGDADEIFTSYFPERLEVLWKHKRSALLCSHIQMIDDFNTFHDGKFYSHCKAFKYRPDLTTYPMIGQGFIRPYKKYQDHIRGEKLVVHMADFNRKFMKKRAHYKNRRSFDEVNVWKTEKDVRELSAEEYKKITEETPPFARMTDYL